MGNRQGDNPPDYSPPEIDRLWGIWGSYFSIPKAIFYLLKGDYKSGVSFCAADLVRRWLGPEPARLVRLDDCGWSTTTRALHVNNPKLRTLL